MMNLVDKLLSKTTMYRLTLYYLASLLAVAILFSLFGILPFSPLYIILITFFLLISSWIVNNVFAKVFEAHSNVESVFITALILALIITPANPFKNIAFLAWVAIWASASKYIFAINKKHLFNPAAFAVVLTSLTIGQSASWWVGNLPMLPFVLIGGLLLVRKIRRFNLIWGFLITVAVTTLGFSIMEGLNLVTQGQRLLFYSPLLFFAFVMLTEPLTAPSTKKLQIIYGMLVGFLFVPQIHLGSFYFTPEIALLLGNVFSYLSKIRET